MPEMWCGAQDKGAGVDRSRRVEINYCGTCQGIWLDKDELPKIIESLEDEIAQKTLSDYFKESVEEAKEVVTGHESFMSEWKDFSSVLKLMQYRLFVE